MLESLTEVLPQVPEHWVSVGERRAPQSHATLNIFITVPLLQPKPCCWLGPCALKNNNKHLIAQINRPKGFFVCLFFGGGFSPFIFLHFTDALCQIWEWSRHLSIWESYPSLMLSSDLLFPVLYYLDFYFTFFGICEQWWILHKPKQTNKHTRTNNCKYIQCTHTHVSKSQLDKGEDTCSAYCKPSYAGITNRVFLYALKCFKIQICEYIEIYMNFASRHWLCFKFCLALFTLWAGL